MWDSGWELGEGSRGPGSSAGEALPAPDAVISGGVVAQVPPTAGEPAQLADVVADPGTAPPRRHCKTRARWFLSEAVFAAKLGGVSRGLKSW